MKKTDSVSLTPWLLGAILVAGIVMAWAASREESCTDPSHSYANEYCSRWDGGVRIPMCDLCGDTGRITLLKKWLTGGPP